MISYWSLKQYKSFVRRVIDDINKHLNLLTTTLQCNVKCLPLIFCFNILTRCKVSSWNKIWLVVEPDWNKLDEDSWRVVYKSCSYRSYCSPSQWEGAGDQVEETETTEGEWDLNMTYGSGGGVRVRWTTVNHFDVGGAGATRVESQNQQFYKSHETRETSLSSCQTTFIIFLNCSIIV